MIKNGAAETRWPTDGDRFFRADHPAYDVPVTSHKGERGYRLPIAYKRAADLLLEHALEDIVYRKNVIYPALFCYRQCIELFLKKLIQIGSGNYPYGHRLDELWRAFILVAREKRCGDSTGTAAAESLVGELHAADERADGFRYPTDAQDGPFTLSDRCVDIENLLDVMNGLTNFFECAAMEFSYQNDASSD